jgi:hypothetical protein
MHPNLLAANVVVQQITALGIAASNRDYSNLIHGEQVTETRFQGLDAGLTQANQGGLNTYGLNDAASIKAAALLVVQHRAGNCQEQAALAFDKLARLGVRPVELMGVYLQDHVLVIAGRLQGALGQQCNFRAWNEDAVVCDPWAKRAYFVTELEDEMQTIRSVTNGETRMGQKFILNLNTAW